MESTPKNRTIADLLDPKRVSIEVKTLETAPEREARLRREAEDAAHERDRKKANEDHERRKDFLLFVASLIIVGGAALGSLGSLMISPTNSPWAAPLLTLIVGGLLGYQTGKAQGSKSGP